MSDNEPEENWYESRRATKAREVPQRRTRDLREQSSWSGSAPRQTTWAAALWWGVSFGVCALVLFVFVHFVVMPSWLAGVLQGSGLGGVIVGILVVGDALGKRSRQ